MDGPAREPEGSAIPAAGDAAAARTRGATRVVALAGIGAALVPWLAVAAGVAVGALAEVGLLVALIAGLLTEQDGEAARFQAIVGVVLAVVLAAPLLFAARLLWISGRLFRDAWRGAAAGRPDVTTLRLCALANVLAALAWAGVWWALARAGGGGDALTRAVLIFAICSAVAALCSVAAVLLVKRAAHPAAAT